MTRLGLTSALATALLFSALGALPARAQVTATDLLVRLDQLEKQVRQLTGAVEQLQYRNQQLETNLRKMQEDNEFRFSELGGKPGGRNASEPRTQAPQPPPQHESPYAPQRQSYTPEQPSSAQQQQNYTPQQPAYAPQQPAYAPPSEPIPLQPSAGQQPSGRRSDAFDPSQNPSAPGAPRQLGSVYASGRADAPASNEGGYGGYGGGLPPPPPRNPNATGSQVATLPPSQSSRDLYDLANGYLARRDFALAEQSFRAFLSQYPSDPLGVDAQYGLGESLFRQQNYRDAADTFLTMTKSHASSARAPDALLRLGQSLAALKEKNLACGAFAEIGRKYPRASPTVKQTVAREQKRVGC